MLSLLNFVLIGTLFISLGGCFWLGRLYLKQKEELKQLSLSATKQIKSQKVKAKRLQAPPFEQILNLIPGGVVISNREGKLIWYNREAAEIIGLTSADLANRSIMSVLSKLPMLISDSMGGPESVPAEFDFNGRRIQGMMYVLYGNDGLDQGTVAVLNDITTWYAALRAKQLQLDTINHELRQRLTSMGSYTELLQGNISEQGKAWLPRLHENVGRVTALIDTIMQVTSVKDDGNLQGLTPISIQKIVYDTLKLLKPELEERKIYLKLQVDKQMRPIMAQTVHIQTIIKELLTNSIRFNRPGGMVQITTGIQKDSDSNQDFLILQIADDGQGIPIEDQKKIFDVFYRPDANENSQHRNIGVGLAIVQAIIQAYQGRIWFRSQPNKGTLFTILLPAGRIEDDRPLEPDLFAEDHEFDWIADAESTAEVYK